MRNNGSHVSLGQASVTDHHCSCPYDDKVVPNGTTARMVLMFIRDLVEPPGCNQVRQTYPCPMRDCRKTFMEPLPLVQHLLFCPELLRSGVFDCDKCSNWHQVPTCEKDWEQWSGWKPQPPPFQRKRSFSSKMRDTFTLRRKDSSRKSNASPEPPHIDYAHSLNIRMNQTALGAVCPEHHIAHSGHRDVPDYLGLQKAVPLDLDRGMFWQAGGVDEISELHSAVSSIAPSSTFDTRPSQPTTANTSRTTLNFAQGFTTYQTPTPSSQRGDNVLNSQQFIFSPQPTFDGEATSIGNHSQTSSAMSLDEPLSVNDSALSPGELRPTTSNNNQTWWGSKQGADTQNLTPVSSGCFPIQSPVSAILPSDVTGELTAPTSPCTSAGMDDRNTTPGPYYPIHHASMHHAISRTLSQESMQDGLPNFFELDGSQIDAMSPHSSHAHHIAIHRKANLEPPTEELMCDECQWKPRGVRENLKGYLRKHKNTHKGLRLACEVPGCTKTFSRLDNLKKHKKDKHGMSDDSSSILPSKRVAEEYVEHIEEDGDVKRPGTSDSRIRGVVAEDYSMLWPALHF
ncbi:hypothetical protein B0H66DRAFT_572506 [Apodospora peruviana]|uniref:C2H2-type domain-containing protein n=1 Tax=Apodospora peruviana TaxID=516989 RepID=A0AAE0ISP4_9PEZI|nr:hypothetical protein B0H66DRAFT_572506 [Apodospora peruviana]